MVSKLLFTEEFCQPEDLYPFTLTRQIQDIRVGIMSIREKWEKALKLESFDKWEEDYKDLGRSLKIGPGMHEESILMLHGNVLPNNKLVKAIKSLKDGEFVSVNGDRGMAFRFNTRDISEPHRIRVTKAITLEDSVQCIRFPWDIFQINDWALREDFRFLTRKRKSQPISPWNRCIKKGNIFLEKGVKMENCILNAETGPIYIGKNATIMEGTVIRGPVAIGEGAVCKAGTQIYGATTIGPYCVVGGEIKNSVFFSHANKAHHGYVGDSVIGSWCNLGAGTSNSNMKNNAGMVRVWTRKGEMEAGKKCGMFMGDYSKTAINTAINTGTVIGVCCNIFGTALTPKYIPSFSWGLDGMQRYRMEDALEDIASWKQLKGEEVTTEENSIIQHIYNNY